ncbi:MAG: hypothetical protein WAV73_01575 [Candidatus Moraniibacteriota bacterium]
MSNELKESAIERLLNEMREAKLPREQQSEKIRELLGLYFQEREIFPMTNGDDVAGWKEAGTMTTFQQIELLEKIVGNSHFHQNLPHDTIWHIGEILKKIDKEAFRTAQD